MRKRFCTVLAALCVCLTAMAQPVSAAGTPRLSAAADAVKADKGQTVKVKISLSGNPEISTLGMSLSYDADAFEYKDCGWNSSLGAGDMKMALGENGSVSLSLVCDKSYSGDGTIATVSFQAKKDGAVVDMDLSLREMADKDLSDVTNCKVSKAVRVPEAAEKNETEASEKTAEKKHVAEKSKKPSTVKNASTAKKSTAAASAKQTSSATASNKLDESYKTGVLAGEDVLFVIAAVCGLAAFIFWNERKKGI